MRTIKNQIRQKKVDALREVLGESRKVAVFLHDNPDPDAIASGLALQHLLWKLRGARSVMVAAGTLRRPENREMIEVMKVRIIPPEQIDLRKYKALACIDTQPGAGNNSLPEKVTPRIVIDHHPLRRRSLSAPFQDIRPGLGATSTILTEYIIDSKVEFPRHLATALFYGVKSDTMNLGRMCTKKDIEAYLWIFPRISQRRLMRIENPRLDSEHYVAIVRSILKARLYGEFVFANLGRRPHVDEIAQGADLLIRTKGVNTALVMGEHDDTLYISVRVLGGRIDSARLIKRIVGNLGSAGGHGHFAGGRINFAGKSPEEKEALRQQVRSRIFATFRKKPEEFEPLIPQSESSYTL